MILAERPPFKPGMPPGAGPMKPPAAGPMRPPGPAKPTAEAEAAAAPTRAAEPTVEKKREIKSPILDNIQNLKEAIQTHVTAIYNTLDELMDISSGVTREIVDRAKDKHDNGELNDIAYHLIEKEYNRMVDDNIDRVLEHLSTGMKEIVRKIDDNITKGFDNLLKGTT